MILLSPADKIFNHPPTLSRETTGGADSDGDQYEVSWKSFWEKVGERAEEGIWSVWQSTILELLRSSQDVRLADRSQILVSGAQAYRAIVTRRRDLIGGMSEVHIYFFEVLKRRDYGDAKSSFFMKAVTVACHYRSMFLEEAQDNFCISRFKVMNEKEFIDNIMLMIRELDWIARESAEIGLNTASARMMIYGADTQKLQADAQEWHEGEMKLRATAKRAIALRGARFGNEYRIAFERALEDFCKVSDVINRSFLNSCLEKLKTTPVDPKNTIGKDAMVGRNGDRSATMTWAEAVAQLTGQRTRAIACVSLLKKYGDGGQIARGQLTYTDAKADADAVIAGLIAALSTGQKPESLSSLQARLESSVTSLAEFRNMVSNLLPATRAQKDLGDILKGAIEQLLKPLSDAVSALYNNHRAADALTRETIKTQLEAARWPDFSEVNAAQ